MLYIYPWLAVFETLLLHPKNEKKKKNSHGSVLPVDIVMASFGKIKQWGGRDTLVLGVWQQCIEFYWKVLEQERNAGSELLGSLRT